MMHKRLYIILAIIGALLLLPLIAMQFTDEVNWRIGDFVMAAILLSVAGLACELMLRKVKKPVYRIALCGVILVVISLVWAELAVGILETVIGGN
jgi:predicted neutral ceramidase superfamily lipid hydrolase